MTRIKKLTTPELEDGVLKVVITGEPRCGKTSLIQSVFERYPDGDMYSYNGVGVYPCRFEVDDQQRRAALFEIPSHPDFLPQQRIPYYVEADAIIFMYAIDDPASLEMLIQNWIPEAYPIIEAQNTMVVFVGNKRDLRNDQQVIERLALENLSPVTVEQGLGLLAGFPLFASLVECCAFHWIDVDRVFETVFILLNR